MLRYNMCEIDLNAIRNNVRVMREKTAGGAAFLAVVKANGYGHGAVPVARAAIEAGASMLAVAIPEEGVELREAGLDLPILVLGGIEPDAARYGRLPSGHNEGWLDARDEYVPVFTDRDEAVRAITAMRAKEEEKNVCRGTSDVGAAVYRGGGSGAAVGDRGEPVCHCQSSGPDL